DLYLARTTQPPPLPLLPYTTLFRSDALGPAAPCHQQDHLPGGTGIGGHARLPGRGAGFDRLGGPTDPQLAHRRRCAGLADRAGRSEEHTSELQSREKLVCRLLLEKK